MGFGFCVVFLDLISVFWLVDSGLLVCACLGAGSSGFWL